MESVTTGSIDAIRGNRQCSTPSGIMESVTDRLRLNRDIEARCSTPSGIMESVTRRGGTGLVCRSAVLNAFRHHGIGHVPSA